MGSREGGKAAAAPERVWALAELGDAELLSRIAARDQEAFACFFERHHRHAYNLALRITHSPSSAEEAAQEALLRVWKHAGGFRPEGSSHCWFMRIVAREAVRQARLLSQAEAARALRPEPDLAGPNSHETEEPGSRELLAELKRHLDLLPALDQRILALYFGAELTQQQIGLELRISQRTVSRRLTQLLAALRRQVQAGASRALLANPLPGLLAQALLAGPGLSAAAQGALLGRLLESVAGSSRPGLRDGCAPTPTFAQRLPLLSAGLLSLGALILLLSHAEGPVLRRDSGARKAAAGAPPVPAGLKAQRELPAPGFEPRSWSFESGDWSAELPRFGPWKMGRLDGRQYLVAREFEPYLTLLLPFRIPPAPFEIRVVLRPAGQGPFNISPLWCGQRQILPHLAWNRLNKENVNGATLSLRFLFLGKYTLLYQAGVLKGAVEYERPYPAEEVAVELRNCAVQELSIRPTPEAEIPESAAEPIDPLVRQLRFRAPTAGRSF